MNGRHSHTLLIKEHDRVKKENHDLKARIENYELQRKSDSQKLTDLMRQLDDCKLTLSELADQAGRMMKIAEKCLNTDLISFEDWGMAHSSLYLAIQEAEQELKSPK